MCNILLLPYIIIHVPLFLTHPLQLSTVQATIVPQSPSEAKKHQLANQLFGGFGGLSGPSRPPKSKQHRKSPTTTTSTTSTSFDTTASFSGGGASNQLRPPRQQVAAASKKPKEPQVDLLLDLEGIDFSSPTTVTTAPSAQEQTTGGTGGLLANMEIRGATTQDATPATSAPLTTRCSIHCYTIYNEKYFSEQQFSYIIRVLTRRAWRRVELPVAIA
jgi:hypothetical protein